MPLPHDYLEEIAAKLEPSMRRAFLQAVETLRGTADTDRVAALLEGGDVAGVIEALGLNDPAWLARFRAAMAEGFVAGGKATHAGIRELIAEAIARDIVPGDTETRIPAVFGVRNLPAEAALRDYDLSAIREIGDGTREGVRAALMDGMIAGRNPRQIALDLCGRIGEGGEREGGVLGLTAAQARFVQNARDELESADPEALRRYLGRELRDRRFDAAVLRAIRSGKPVPEATRDKAATAYNNAFLRHRAETVARMESLRAASVGQEAALQNAIASGALPEGMRQWWIYTNDDRTRPAHREIPDMNPEGIPLGEAFDTPLGPLRYPRDPQGTAENIIGCRCERHIGLTAGNQILDLINPPPAVGGAAPGAPAGSREAGGGGPSGDGSGGGSGGGDGSDGGGDRWRVTRADFEAVADRLEVPDGDRIVRAWNRYLPGLKPADFHDGFFAGVGDRVQAKLRLNLAGKGGFEAEIFKNGVSTGVLERRFDLKARTFDHSAFYVEAQFQAHGLARRFLANSFAMYRELGIRSVGIQARNVGAYAWSNIGFVPTPGSWSALQGAAIERLEKVKGRLSPTSYRAAVAVLTHPDPARLRDIRNLGGSIEGLPLGKYLLLGQKWDGTLDLTDADSLRAFTSYLRRR